MQKYFAFAEVVIPFLFLFLGGYVFRSPFAGIFSLAAAYFLCGAVRGALSSAQSFGTCVRRALWLPLLIVVFGIGAVSFRSIFDAETRRSFFEDGFARLVGDTVDVLLMMGALAVALFAPILKFGIIIGARIRSSVRG